MSDQAYKAYLTKGASVDIEGIKDYTLENYGLQATDAYLGLIEQAVQDLQDDPFRPGSRARDEIAPQARSYPISLSRRRAESEIKSPRHFILYYTPGESRVEIDRIWHESRDLKRYASTHSFEIEQSLSDIKVPPPTQGRGRRR